MDNLTGRYEARERAILLLLHCITAEYPWQPSAVNNQTHTLMSQETGFTNIKDILVQRTIIVEGADPVSAGGFTQVPNCVLENNKLSAGAKLTYAMLLKYAWQNDYCFPGQERLAKDMGAGKRSVVRFMAELEEHGFVTIKRRGQGKTNVYIVHFQTRKSVDKKKHDIS